MWLDDDSIEPEPSVTKMVQVTKTPVPVLVYSATETLARILTSALGSVITSYSIHYTKLYELRRSPRA